MEYALLFHTSEERFAAIPPAERQVRLAEMMDWTNRLREAGVFRSSFRMASKSSSTCVRGDGARLLVTDGPFAESKEYLGGFCIIEVPDLDAALAWAKRCPIARAGTVEVRPKYAA
jgi:hypothetical protein